MNRVQTLLSMSSHGFNGLRPCATVPLLQGIRLVAVGSGLIKNESAIRAVSREGSPKVRGCKSNPGQKRLVSALERSKLKRDEPLSKVAFNFNLSPYSKELLRGPLFYTVVLVACTALFWRTSPPGRALH